MRARKSHNEFQPWAEDPKSDRGSVSGMHVKRQGILEEINKQLKFRVLANMESLSEFPKNSKRNEGAKLQVYDAVIYRS